MGIFLLVAICFIIGVSIAIKLALWAQALVLIAVIWFMNSEWVRQQEIGALLWMALGMWGVIGMAVGDAYFFFTFQQTGPAPVDVWELLKWPFKP
jgi:hypothetical protein